MDSSGISAYKKQPPLIQRCIGSKDSEVFNLVFRVEGFFLAAKANSVRPLEFGVSQDRGLVIRNLENVALHGQERRDMNSLVRRFWRRSSLLSSLILLITIGLLMAGFALPSFAQTPDPAGVATGDKTNGLDAAGNPFVISEPMDKNAPHREPPCPGRPVLRHAGDGGGEL